MSIVLAAAPILFSVVMILALRQSTLCAGAAGLATALLVALLAPGYRPALALAAGGLGGLAVLLWIWIG